MKSRYTFKKGGIHPPDRKTATNKVPITTLSLPETLVLPLGQHLGAPAEPLVEKGDKIEEGQLIGAAKGFISANIHAPCSGEIKNITELFLPNGVKTNAFEIAVDPEWSPKEYAPADWSALESKEIIKKIAEAGIVGLGGATFPANVKLSVPEGETAEFLILNGTECEPYLTSDHRVMLEHTKELLEGAKILEKALGPKRVCIGIEENKMDAVAAFEKIIQTEGLSYELFPLKMQYPQGDEKQLIKAITGREVPSGKLPIHVGTVVFNVSTVMSVYDAIACGKPLMERVVTVTGACVKKPGNFRVRFGTPVDHLIEACGGLSEVPEKLVAGGPMMGFAFTDTSIPVIKGTSGILALSSSEMYKNKRVPCISCGRCIEVCPMGLNPTKLFKFIEHQEYDEAMSIHLMDCKECGCCGFTCPSHIPLVQGMKLGKKIARKQKVKA